MLRCLENVIMLHCHANYITLTKEINEFMIKAGKKNMKNDVVLLKYDMLLFVDFLS